MADAKTDKRPDKSQTHEPAKGGLKPAHEMPIRPATARSAGDKLQHAVEKASSQS